MGILIEKIFQIALEILRFISERQRLHALRVVLKKHGRSLAVTALVLIVFLSRSSKVRAMLPTSWVPDVTTKLVGEASAIFDANHLMMQTDPPVAPNKKELLTITEQAVPEGFFQLKGSSINVKVARPMLANRAFLVKGDGGEEEWSRTPQGTWLYVYAIRFDSEEYVYIYCEILNMKDTTLAVELPRHTGVYLIDNTFQNAGVGQYGYLEYRDAQRQWEKAGKLIIPQWKSRKVWFKFGKLNATAHTLDLQFDIGREDTAFHTISNIGLTRLTEVPSGKVAQWFKDPDRTSIPKFQY